MVVTVLRRVSEGGYRFGKVHLYGVFLSLLIYASLFRTLRFSVVEHR